MKRLFLTLSCIVSVIWLLPCFVHASYTAPNGIEYEYKVNTSTGNYNTRYFTIYSNNKMCTVSSSTYGGGKVVLGLYNTTGGDYCISGIATQSGTINTNYDPTGKYPSSANVDLQSESYYVCWRNNSTVPDIYNLLCDYNCTNDSVNLPNFDNFEDAYDYMTMPEVDFDNLYYDPTIPTPEFVVTMERPTPWEDVTTDTNYFDVTFNEYGGYYVQLGYKFSYPNGMKVGLVDGQVTYTPLTYANSIYFDVFALQDLQTADNLNIVDSSYFDLVSLPIQESESWQTSVPIWANNFNNSKYASARNKWNTKMRYCWPLYGNKLEIFERLFYVADGVCYVGAWKHWNNTYPTEYNEEIPNNYQVGNSMPGYQNTNNNTDYQEQEYTQTTIGTQTGVNNTPTVVVNNLTPNYPEYPTVATYNHDNILLQMIDSTKRLPSFFGEFTDFCKECLTVLPSEIWVYSCS